MTVTIDSSCTACGMCLHTCPTRALVAAPKRPLVIDGLCDGCLACVEICPRDAISPAAGPTATTVFSTQTPMARGRHE